MTLLGHRRIRKAGKHQSWKQRWCSLCWKLPDRAQSFDFCSQIVRGTQRRFLENICSEDDLRSRIFGTFVVKFLACLSLLGFSIGRFCDINCVQSYFDTLLRYVLSVNFCGAAVMKVMDQKTLVKRRWSYKVHITAYILTLSEFARHEFTNLWLETLPDTLSFSLTGIRLSPKQVRRVNNG